MAHCLPHGESNIKILLPDIIIIREEFVVLLVANGSTKELAIVCWYGRKDKHSTKNLMKSKKKNGTKKQPNGPYLLD